MSQLHRHVSSVLQSLCSMCALPHNLPVYGAVECPTYNVKFWLKIHSICGGKSAFSEECCGAVRTSSVEPRCLGSWTNISMGWGAPRQELGLPPDKAHAPPLALWGCRQEKEPVSQSGDTGCCRDTEDGPKARVSGSPPKGGDSLKREDEVYGGAEVRGMQPSRAGQPSFSSHCSLLASRGRRCAPSPRILPSLAHVHACPCLGKPSVHTLCALVTQEHCLLQAAQSRLSDRCNDSIKFSR